VIRLDEIRDCLEGWVPSAVATCSADGIPNVSYLSQVEYLDASHVALSFQFFNKTRENVLANPHATVAVIDPESAAAYRLFLTYVRTETHGSLFERMKAKLASIASATGTTGVFRLRGADIYRVERIERLGNPELPKAPRKSRLTAVRALSDELSRVQELGATVDALLAGLERHFDIQHAMVLAVDTPGHRFYIIGSRGYDVSGVGSEIPVDAGAVGIAAARGTPVRISFASTDYAYVRAVRDNAAKDPVWASRLESAIPFPGLKQPNSQLAIPLDAGGSVLGVLYVESDVPGRFTYEDEDALVVLSRQLALAMKTQEPADAAEGKAPPALHLEGPPIVVRHYPDDDSVFLDEAYLIKGVAGAILWKLVRVFVQEGRDAFSNRELRLDKRLGLPDVADNLESRLVLLERRLRERGAGLLLEKTGRGRFRLAVSRQLALGQGASSTKAAG
jgi:hypothetical protein